MKYFIESKGIELIIDPEVEEKIICCDEAKIEKCVINLIANSIKFTQSGGQIEVKILDLGMNVKIVVKDSGIGIEKNTMNQYLIDLIKHIIKYLKSMEEVVLD